MSALHPRHRIDATASDIASALAAMLVPGRRGPPPAEDDAIVGLSMRSAFDLLLGALDLPAGDEVLVTAITHPDMARILRLHGLRPVPIDVDPATLAPDPSGLAAAVTPRTRAVLVAHLFGARIDLDAVIAVARRHGLLVVEDCAQLIEGPTDRGDPRCDVSLFSFGLIKTATAFGGALVRVGDAHLAARIRAAHEQWPLQPPSEYTARVAKAAAALVRTVPLGDDAAFLRWLRRRPCPALAAKVARRARHFPTARLAARAAAGRDLVTALPPGLLRPGQAVARSTHWLFPVVAPDPSRLIAALEAAGFEATRGTSQIVAIPPAPPCARQVMEGIVFLPAYPELPAPERRRLVEVVSAIV